MKTWGFGVIGCGNIADFHIFSIQNLSRARLAGVSSRNLQKAKEIGINNNCFFTDDYKKLLSRSDVDIVCITSSSGSHASIAMDALRAHKHIIVEKPISMTDEEAVNIIELAKRDDLKVAVISQRRFEKRATRMKKLLEAGEIGRLLLIEAFTPYYRSQNYYDAADWRGTLDQDGGALMNQGIHQLDLMIWYGGEVRSVQGRVATKAHRMEAEDVGLAIVTFSNNVNGMIMSSTHIVPGFSSSIHLYGSKGTMKLKEDSLTIWRQGEEAPVTDRAERSDSGDASRNPMAFSYKKHQEQINEFIEALENNRSPAITGEDGRNTVRLIEAIYESSRTKAEVQLL